MMKKLICIFYLFFLINISCKTNTDAISNDDKTDPDFIYTKADSIEAIELSGWLCGRLLPTDSLISDILYKLKLLRNIYGDSIAALDSSNRLLLPWVSRELLVNFDSSTVLLINNNNYTGWDTLDNIIQPDTILSYPDILGLAWLGFDEYLHPKRLAEIYEELPGVEYAEPNYIGFFGWGDYPWFPGWIDNKLVLLFPNSRFINQRNFYYYFKYIDNQPIHIGTYDVINDSIPNWWAEADRVKSVYSTWDGF